MLIIAVMGLAVWCIVLNEENNKQSAVISRATKEINSFTETLKQLSSTTSNSVKMSDSIKNGIAFALSSSLDTEARHTVALIVCEIINDELKANELQQQK